MPVVLIFGEVCPQSIDRQIINLHRLFHKLHSLNYLLFDQCLHGKQFLWIAYSEK